MDGEAHRVTLLLGDDRDGRSAAVLYRVANQIRHDLRQPVAVPLASQVPARLQSHGGLGVCGADFSQCFFADLLKIDATFLQGN